MRRLIAATIALTLLSSTAALADGWYGHDGYDAQTYRHETYRHENNSGAIVAAGVGLAALAIIASQHHHHDRPYIEGRYGERYGYERSRYFHRDYNVDGNRYDGSNYSRYGRGGDGYYYNRAVDGDQR